ncbi:hypothetical protein JOD57_004857 [Geodermatophilus bullaregiensis]|uniref:hypothetical protein n=1 Tax=Geodermatophilus bullaregiensis TaxID=1564160 RepID=UPI0019594E0B|nr:hypothetical protein [Geodermatophilus bullaregiensis]MBM7809020.1 hypothetical protein [Geodermatophilus bullaregiensis]
MTDLEPVEPDAVLPRAARPVVHPAAGSSGSRAVVAAGIRALAGGPLLPVAALAVTAVTAARVAAAIARLARGHATPAGPAVVGRVPGAPAPGATQVSTLQVSWTQVEVRWRW